MPRPTSTWHHLVECQRAVASESSPSFAGGMTCRAGRPCRTRTAFQPGGQFQMPPPRDCNAAPQNDCLPASRARRAMTDWPVAVSLVSPSSTTSASHAKTVWQWGRSAVTFETATRSGPWMGVHVAAPRQPRPSAHAAARARTTPRPQQMWREEGGGGVPCQPPTARVGGAVAGSQHACGPAGAPRKRKVRPPCNGPVRGAGSGARPGQRGGRPCPPRVPARLH